MVAEDAGLPGHDDGQENPLDQRKKFPPPSAPLDVARDLYADYRQHRARTLVCWRGGWMVWRGGHWSELDTAELRSDIYDVLSPLSNIWRPSRLKAWPPPKRSGRGHRIGTRSATSWKRWPRSVTCQPTLIPRPGSTYIARTFQRIRWSLAVTACWVSPPGPFAITPRRSSTWSRCRSTTTRRTQTGRVARVPGSLWPDDMDSIALLQEYFGYVLSGRTDMQKMLLLIGPTRSGKGTIARMLTALIGRGHVAGPRWPAWAPTSACPRCWANLWRSSPTPGWATPSHTVVERLLSITGEDMLTVDRKFRDPWSGQAAHPVRDPVERAAQVQGQLRRDRQPAADPADD